MDLLKLFSGDTLSIMLVGVCGLFLLIVVIFFGIRQVQYQRAFIQYLTEEGWTLFPVEKRLTLKGFQSGHEIAQKFPLHPVEKGRTIHYLAAEKTFAGIRYVTQIEKQSVQLSGKWDLESTGTTELWTMYIQVEPLAEWKPELQQKIIDAVTAQPSEHAPHAKSESEDVLLIDAHTFGTKGGLEMSIFANDAYDWRPIHEHYLQIVRKSLETYS